MTPRDTYLLKSTRKLPLPRPPVWMMRQAGRYMRAYRELRERYPSFRQRSETPELAVEISLQPFRAFAPDGVILFSDILTPLPGMGIDFDIIESRGPIIDPPIRTAEQIRQLRPLEPAVSLPFIGQILRTLRAEIGDRATLLGFVGAPWTLAAYVVEGQSSRDYTVIKSLAYHEPQVLHQLLGFFAEQIATYVIYQIEQGAEVVQIFDSWAGQLSPLDYRTFVLPYQQKLVQKVKAVHPETPLILYIYGSGAILELMAQSGVDVISLDWTVEMGAARRRLGDLCVQGNLDPGVLFGPPALIRERVKEIIQQAGPVGHIMNLGHGVLATTPEDHVRVFFETVKQTNWFDD
ncbi:MAG: uroporphyrinogen decarboxylase [Gloeomargarita sp. SKYBB_i_bin120]|nr:uroporphyrinogen decarboxylase [Gloeomargarita sp. SKYB120]MDW8177132.1 uroporphyrinogen decarboxylase [Gloeomargarita sp. SKYBB_i_bin120]